MKTGIFGVGRSGTSALYALLQKIMIDQLGPDCDFVYEPFLWDRGTFNGRYETYSEKFGYINSLSTEGLYHHQHIPLFMKDPLLFSEHPFIASLTNPSEGKKHLLLKAIRINGRFEAFCSRDPSMKFVFMIRNPLDVVNSVVRLFSFFGGDFHRDDSARFVTEVESLFGEHAPMGTLVEQCASYWLYMNRFVIERLHKHQAQIMAVSHEDFVSNQADAVARICSHLGFDFKSEYATASEEKMGVITSRVYLTRREFLSLEGLLDRYVLFLEKIGLPGIEKDEIFKRYEHTGFLESSHGNLSAGKTANAMRRELTACVSQKERLSRDQRELASTVEKLDGQVRNQKKEIEHCSLLLKEKKLLLEKTGLRLQKSQSRLQEIQHALREANATVNSLANSRSYRIGRFLLSPLIFIANTVWPKNSDAP